MKYLFQAEIQKLGYFFIFLLVCHSTRHGFSIRNLKNTWIYGKHESVLFTSGFFHAPIVYLTYKISLKSVYKVKDLPSTTSP